MEVAEQNLEIQESLSAPPVVQADGTVKLNLIRPCVGKGKGRHLYESRMLQENAGKLSGWRMYVDHETQAERRARGGLPRSIKDLGGIVLESKWDPTVPAEGRFGQGAIVGTVRPIKEVGDLIALHPSLVECSINARATGVRPVMAEGARAWLVEGLENTGSVDWVTEGGAGGRVASLLEAAFDDSPEGQEMALFESMTAEELQKLIEDERPEVAAAIAEAASKVAGDGGGSGTDDEAMAACVQKYLKKGLPQKLAEKAAAREMADAKSAQEAAASIPNEGDAVAEVTPEQLQEALASPEFQEALATKVSELVEAGIEKERGALRAGAEVYADRQIELRDMRDAAHRQITEAKLPVKFEERLLCEFAISDDGRPTEALDVFESVDDDNKVTETAADALKKVVEAKITETRELVGSVAPSRVRGQGASAPAGDGSGEAPKRDTMGEQTRAILQEAGLDPEKVFSPEAFALRG